MTSKWVHKTQTLPFARLTISFPSLLKKKQSTMQRKTSTFKGKNIGSLFYIYFKTAMRRRTINIKLLLFQNKGLGQGYWLLLFGQVTA